MPVDDELDLARRGGAPGAGAWAVEGIAKEYAASRTVAPGRASVDACVDVPDQGVLPVLGAERVVEAARAPARSTGVDGSSRAAAGPASASTLSPVSTCQQRGAVSLVDIVLHPPCGRRSATGALM